MSTKNMFNNDFVIQQLREAFSFSETSHDTLDIELQQSEVITEDKVKLRSNLIRFYPEDIQELLPEVLIELLDTGDRSDVDLVIYTLDVPTYENEEYLVELEGEIGNGYAETVKRTKEEAQAYKAQIFAIFSPKQAWAIKDWLLAVEQWPELSFIKLSVQSAIEYWSKRASQCF